MQGIKIFVILVILLSLLGCDVLLAPRKPRNNPYDEENQLPLKINLNPRLEMNGGEYKLFIGITNETDTREIKGYLLIKNRIAPPVNVFDGQCVYSIPLHEMSNDKGLEDSHLQTGNDVYYGIWAYGGENTDDYLDVDENGNIVETSMQYSGPRLITARWGNQSQRFYPNSSKTGYIEANSMVVNNRNWGYTYLRPEFVDYNYGIISFLTFNLDGMPSSIPQAMLTLYTGNMNDELNLEFNYINQSWDEATIDYNLAKSNDFFNSGLLVNFHIGSDDDNRRFDIDITNIANQWAMGPNNGMRIYNQYETNSGQLWGPMAGDQQPVLSIPSGFSLQY